MKLLTDAGTVFSREMTPTLRNPIGLLFLMVQPALFLLLFGPLLGVGGSWEWFVPGILVMLALFGATGGASLLLIEVTGGSLERMLVTPLNRGAMLVGRTLKDVLTLLAQALLLVAVALPLGLRVHPARLAAGLALLALFATGVCGLAFALALASKKHPDLFYTVEHLALFPLVLLAGVLLPLEAGPGWLRAIAGLNPVTYVVEAERALFRGDFGADVVWGLAAAGGVAAVGIAVGVRAMRRASL